MPTVLMSRPVEATKVKGSILRFCRLGHARYSDVR
jgi:hypothetical protein